HAVDPRRDRARHDRHRGAERVELLVPARQPRGDRRRRGVPGGLRLGGAGGRGRLHHGPDRRRGPRRHSRHRRVHDGADPFDARGGPAPAAGARGQGRRRHDRVVRHGAARCRAGRAGRAPAAVLARHHARPQPRRHPALAAGRAALPGRGRAVLPRRRHDAAAHGRRDRRRGADLLRAAADLAEPRARLLPGHQPVPAVDRRCATDGRSRPRRGAVTVAGLRRDARLGGARAAGRCGAPASEGRLSTPGAMAAAEHPPRPSARADDVFRISQVRRRGPVRRWFLAHPRAMDAVVAAWFGLPSLVTVAELRHTTRPLDVVDPAAAPWILLALSTVSTAALLLRRQHPLAVLAVTVGSAVVVTALLGNTYGHEFAVCFAAYAVASQRPPGTAWLSNLAAIALGAGTVMLAGDSSSIDPGVEGVSEPLPPLLGLGIAATFLALVVMVAHAIGMSVRARREHERALVDRANRIVLERDQREQLAAAAERARIAREMHDVVAHSLS